MMERLEPLSDSGLCLQDLVSSHDVHHGHGHHDSTSLGGGMLASHHHLHHDSHTHAHSHAHPVPTVLHHEPLEKLKRGEFTHSRSLTVVIQEEAGKFALLFFRLLPYSCGSRNFHRVVVIPIRRVTVVQKVFVRLGAYFYQGMAFLLPTDRIEIGI